MMKSSSPTQHFHNANNNNNDPFVSLPIEVTIQIICRLPSFSDILALAATCRRLAHIWSENVGFIYQHIAPKAINCEHDARIPLADQVGEHSLVSLSVSHVLRLLRNVQVVEKAISEFNREIVCNARIAPGPETGKCYYEGTTVPRSNRWRHPPCLTATERPRFIRAYYQFWSLLIRRDPALQRQRLESLTLKELYRMWEIPLLRHYIGDHEDEGTIPAASYPCGAREALQCEIRFQINRSWFRIHAAYFASGTHPQSSPYHTVHDDKCDGFHGHVVFFDHYQDMLKYYVLADAYWRPSMDRMKECVWGDSEDEEG